jgi:hypothetical protein
MVRLSKTNAPATAARPSAYSPVINAGVQKGKKTPATKKNKGAGGSHYSSEEVSMMLDIVARILPSGEYMWERVSVEYNAKRPRGSAYRDVESLRNKFKTLKNCKKPTGDPKCPENVKRAKRIQKEIDNEVGATLIDDDSSESGRDSESSESSAMSSKIESEDSEEQSDEEQFSPVDRREELDPITQDRPYVVEETLPQHSSVVPESIFGGTDAQPVESPPFSPPKTKDLDSAPRQSQNKLQNARAPKDATKSKPPAVTDGRIPHRLGVTDDHLKNMVQEVLRGEDGKKKKSHKHSKEIPENPNRSKKASLAKEINDVNDAFVREGEEQNLKFEMAKRDQDFRHIQEMERIKSEREIADRKYEADMAARREDRALDASRQSQLMSMQMGFFAALLGGRGIAPLVQPSSLPSDGALNN